MTFCLLLSNKNGKVFVNRVMAARDGCSHGPDPIAVTKRQVALCLSFFVFLTTERKNAPGLRQGRFC